MDRMQENLLRFAAGHQIVIQAFLSAAGQPAQALHWLENCALVHGDIKPDRIFLATWARSLRLGDFEFAQHIRDELLTKKVGTPFYWSPKMFADRVIHLAMTFGAWEFAEAIFVAWMSVPTYC